MTPPSLPISAMAGVQSARRATTSSHRAHNDPVAAVTDPNGVQWNVHRRWWPFPDVTDVIDLDWFLLSLVVAVPFVVLWPVWYAAKFCGVRWRIVIERDGTQVGHELVRGSRHARARVADLALTIAAGRRSGHFVL